MPRRAEHERLTLAEAIGKVADPHFASRIHHLWQDELKRPGFGRGCGDWVPARSAGLV